MSEVPLYQIGEDIQTETEVGDLIHTSLVYAPPRQKLISVRFIHFGSAPAHARPFSGVFQKSISIRFVNFW